MSNASIRSLSHPAPAPAKTRRIPIRSFAADCLRTARFSWRALALLLAIGAAFCSVAGGQPTVHFIQSESTLPLTGASAPAPLAVVVDKSGSLYVTDYGNDAVVKLAPSGTGYTQTTVMDSSSGLVDPRYIAVDDSGNVYVADYGGHQIYRVAPSGGSAPVSLLTPNACGTNPCAPAGIAYDPNGNGWVLFTSFGDPHVWYVPASGGSPNPFPQFSDLSQPVGVAWGTTGPGPNPTGNLFVSDYNLNEVVELTWNGAWSAESAPMTTGLLNPSGITADSNGNVYIANQTNNAVVKVRWTGSGWDTGTTVSTSSLNIPDGVAIDTDGNIFIADRGNHRLLKESHGAVTFGSVAVGVTSSTSSLFFAFDKPGTLGSTAVLTQGATGLDFADTHTGTCTQGHYNAGDVCSIKVAFKPRYAGARYGAAILKDVTGNVLATAYMYGTGTGPQIAFAPVDKSGAPLSERSLTMSGTSPAPVGIATDARGNVYVSDLANNQVVKLVPAQGGGNTQQLVMASGLAGPRGIAVDGDRKSTRLNSSHSSPSRMPSSA